MRQQQSGGGGGGPSWLIFSLGAISGVVATLGVVKFLNKKQRRLMDAELDDEETDEEEERDKVKYGDQRKQNLPETTRRISSNRMLGYGERRRERLPSYIILVRHGESEGNADQSLYRTCPDNQVRLTDTGKQQAREAGVYIEEQIFQKAHKIASQAVGVSDEIKRIHLVVSPFERTLETASQLRKAFEHRVVRTDIQPRIREQEFGNLQGDDFKSFREEQKQVGRFWYRFPTGESGSDVYDRVKTWWYCDVQTVNERVGYEEVDALVVVTHGLTMRFVLMQLYSWSPNTFHSVWNAGNCDIYVLRKDLSKPGMAPYVLDGNLGDMPRSSINLNVKVQNPNPNDSGRTITHTLTLADFLSVPPPRTTHLNIIKKMIVKQYPNLIPNEDDIVSVETVAWGTLNKGRSIKNPNEQGSFLHHEKEAQPQQKGEAPETREKGHVRGHSRKDSISFFRESFGYTKNQEQSCRFPEFPWVEQSIRKSELHT